MRFVTPATRRLDLEDGDWIDVKQELTVGELLRFQTSGFKRVRADRGGDQDFELDLVAMKLAKVDAYLVDWSAKKADGKDLPYSRTALEALDAATFTAIEAAIDGHVERMAQEKKDRTGSAPPTLPSP